MLFMVSKNHTKYIFKVYQEIRLKNIFKVNNEVQILQYVLRHNYQIQ